MGDEASYLECGEDYYYAYNDDEDVENEKVCCNCRHCKRIRKYSQIDEREVTVCHCEVDHCYLGYIELMTYRCRHWAKEKERKGAEE